MKIKSLAEHKMNKKGNLMALPMNIMMLFMAVVILIALLPAFNSMISSAQGSDALNCEGFNMTAHPYNASLPHNNGMACMVLNIYILYIVLGVIIGGVAYLFMKNPADQTQGGY